MTTRYVCLVAGGALHVLDTTAGVYKPVGGGFLKDQVYDFMNFNDILYVANGEDKVKAFDGVTLRDAGIDAVGSAPVVALKAVPNGGALIGTYRYRVAFYNSRNLVVGNPSPVSKPITTSTESDAYTTGSANLTRNNDSTVGVGTAWSSNSHLNAIFSVNGDEATYRIVARSSTTQFDLDRPYEGKGGSGKAYKIRGSKVTVSVIPTSADRQVTSRRLYRTDGADPDRFYFLDDISNNTATTYNDNISDDSLGALAQVVDDAGTLIFAHARPPRLGFLESYKGRAFGAGDKDAPTKLYYSEITDPESWGPSTFNFVDFDEGDGDEITGLAALPNMLMVLKRDSIHALMGDAPANFVRRRLVSDAGCVSNNSIVTVGRMLVWMGEDNVYSFDGAAITPLASHIAATLRALNTSRQKFIHAVHYQRRRQVWFTCSDGASTTNNTILVVHYDLSGSGGDPAWTRFDIRAASLAEVEEADDNTVIYHGDYYGHLCKDDVLYNDGVGSSGTVSGSADIATATTLRDNDGAFPTAGDGLKGVLVRILSGVGSGQERTVDTNTASTLTIGSAWTTTPSSNSWYAVGPIRAYAETPKTDFGTIVDKKRTYWHHLQVSRESSASA